MRIASPDEMCADRRNASGGCQFEEAADETHFGDVLDRLTDVDGLTEDEFVVVVVGLSFEGRRDSEDLRGMTRLRNRQDPRISDIGYSYPRTILHDI